MDFLHRSNDQFTGIIKSTDQSRSCNVIALRLREKAGNIEEVCAWKGLFYPKPSFSKCNQVFLWPKPHRTAGKLRKKRKS